MLICIFEHLKNIANQKTYIHRELLWREFRNQIKTVFHNLFKQNHHEMLEMSDAEKYFIIWHHIEICKKRSIFGDDELHNPYHCTLMGQVT